jgi:hypothetical protein
MIGKVISGGQTGVDQAALRAAKACGIPTGGWAPIDLLRPVSEQDLAGRGAGGRLSKSIVGGGVG